MSRMKVNTARTKRNIRRWEKTHFVIPERSEAFAALALLDAKGCNPDQLLELLRIYRSQKLPPYEKAKKLAEARYKKVEEFEDKLKEVAALAFDLYGDDPPVREELLTIADDVAGMNRIHKDASFNFGREFGGTFFLVLASALIKVTTRRFHYKEIADILAVFPDQESVSKECSTSKAANTPTVSDPRMRAIGDSIAIVSAEKSKRLTTESEDAIRKKITRFRRERNPEAIAGGLRPTEIRTVVRFWVNAWHFVEAEFGAGQQNPKSVQVQRTLTGTSSQTIKAQSQRSSPALKSESKGGGSRLEAGDRVQSSKIKV